VFPITRVLLHFDRRERGDDFWRGFNDAVRHALADPLLFRLTVEADDDSDEPGEPMRLRAVYYANEDGN
jgi:hypothetical protein